MGSACSDFGIRLRLYRVCEPTGRVNSKKLGSSRGWDRRARDRAGREPQARRTHGTSYLRARLSDPVGWLRRRYSDKIRVIHHPRRLGQSRHTAHCVVVRVIGTHRRSVRRTRQRAWSQGVNSFEYVFPVVDVAPSRGSDPSSLSVLRVHGTAFCIGPRHFYDRSSRCGRGARLR